EVEPGLSQNGNLSPQQLESLLDNMGGNWFPQQGPPPEAGIRPDQMQMQMPGQAGFQKPRSEIPMVMPSQPTTFNNMPQQSGMPAAQMPFFGGPPQQAPQQQGFFGRNQQQQPGQGQTSQQAAQAAVSAVQYELSFAAQQAAQAEAYRSQAYSVQDRGQKNSAASEARYYANAASASAARAVSKAQGYPEALSLVGAVQAQASRAQSAASSASGAASGW
ncbi:MAG: hypothetical protein K8F91_13980, partial [Candidatus Obscuribacterales bacterium]|nr:hypothetical protein [Candidatus Obscuribacterales bacterium]